MAISRRLIDLARANLNAILDAVGGDDDEPETSSDGSAAARRSRRRRASAAETEDLEARLREELERYDGALSEQEKAQAEYDRFKARVRASKARRSSAAGSGRRRHASRSGRTGNRAALAQHYANLGVAVGTPWPEVKRAYRRLAGKYHPDRQHGNPERVRIANELQLKLNRSYQELKRARRS